MYGTGLKGGFGLRHGGINGEWAPTNLGSPNPNDYAGIMREIDQFNKLTREANDQTHMLEDQIIEFQQKIYQVEVDSQRAREEMIKRMINDDVLKQPAGRSGSRGKPANAPPQQVAAHSKPACNPAKPPIDSKSRGNTSSLHTLIKESMRTLPGMTEFVKNSELLERFRQSYAKDLQEYYKMNSSNIRRELIDKSDTPGLSSYSEVNSQLYQASGVKGYRSGEHGNLGHNQTIKEADEFDEDGGRMNVTSKDTSRPPSVISNRPKEVSTTDRRGSQHTAQEVSEPKDTPGWDEKIESDLESKLEAGLLRNLKREKSAAEGTAEPAIKLLTKVVSNISQKGPSSPPKQTSELNPDETPKTQENKWITKAGNVNKAQTNTTHKTTSLREEDYATNFGQNDSDSGDVTPKVRTVGDRSVETPNDGILEEDHSLPKKRYGTTNLMDSEKKVKPESSSTNTKRTLMRTPEAHSPIPQQIQTTNTLTASHKKEDTITFKPQDPNSHSGKKPASERFTGNSELDPRRLGEEFTSKQKEPSRFASNTNTVTNGRKDIGEPGQKHHVYKDSCFDTSGFGTVDGDGEYITQTNKETEKGRQNVFLQHEEEDDVAITDSELRKVKMEFEQIIEANKPVYAKQERVQGRRKLPHHDEKLILEEDFGPELLTNPDMVGDASKSQVGIRHSKPLPDGSSLDYSNTRRFTEEGFRSNTEQNYGTGTLQSRRLGSGTQPKVEMPTQQKILSDFSVKQDKFEGTGGSQWKPSIHGGSHIRFGTSNDPNSPISLQILDRERSLPAGEIEKNFGFGASDVSLLKKKSEQKEPVPEDSRLDMFRDSAIGYDEYVEKLKAQSQAKKTVLEPIAEKIVPKPGSAHSSAKSEQPRQFPSRRVVPQSALLESELSAVPVGHNHMHGSGYAKDRLSQKDSGVVSSRFPRSIPDSSKGEQYLHFDEEIIVDGESELRGLSDALGKSSNPNGSKKTLLSMPQGTKMMVNSLDDLEEYIEGSQSKLPYSVHSGEYATPSKSGNRYSRDSGAVGSELHDDVYIDDDFERQTSGAIEKSEKEPRHTTGHGHNLSSQVEEEELSLSMGTKNPQGIFKNKLGKQVQRTNRYTGD